MAETTKLRLAYDLQALAVPLLFALTANNLFSALAERIPWSWLLSLTFTWVILLGVQAFHPLFVWLDLRLELKYALRHARPRWWLGQTAGESFLVSLVGIILFAKVYGLSEPAWETVDWTSAVWLYIFYGQLRALLPLLHLKITLAGAEVQARAREIGTRMKLKPPKVAELTTPHQPSAAYVVSAFFHRLLISSKLREMLSPEELDAVLAHELAHARYILMAFVPVWTLVVFSMSAISFGLPRLEALFGVSPRNPMGLPLFLFLCEGVRFLVAPLTNAVSRWIEHWADLSAINATQNPEAFARAMAKVYDHNLIYAAPTRAWQILFATHPTGIERVELAMKWRPPGSDTDPGR